MIEGMISGIVQGVAEWLPVSSEGMLVLVNVTFFEPSDIDVLIRGALLLHLGTFLAALVYFRREVWQLLRSLFRFSSASVSDKNVLLFLTVSTVISGGIGYVFLKILVQFADGFRDVGKIITVMVGVLLLITAWLQIRARDGGEKGVSELRVVDGILLGVVQAFAVLPGLSRSGLTVSALLLRKFGKEWSLKLSFLMSLPIVLAGNIVLNVRETVITTEMMWGLVFSFIFGLLTIDVLLRIARKVNFGYFVLLFGVLTIVAVFV